MPKIIYNETDTMVQFNNECSHKIWLYPKGSLDPKHSDHAEISMAEAKHPNIEKFRQAGKISVLSLEQAHARENPPVAAVEQKPAKVPAPVVEAKPEPVVETKPEPKAEPAPVVETTTESAVEETMEEEADDSADKSSSKKGKGRRNR